MLTLLTGGARSGKSSTAVRLASESAADVAFVATAEAGDDEMAQRIAHHRTERPADWVTIEAPVEVAVAVSGVGTDDTVIVDCLALWVTNLLDRTDEEIEAAAADLAAVLGARRGDTIVVTNEVGSGIVPDNALARRFRDVLGTVNRCVAEASDRAFLCVAGGVVEIQRV